MKNEQDSRAQTSYRYRFGTAEFDEARFELRVAGLPVDVERRALEVLAYLLRHAGEVVTKEELFREVWAGRITVDKVLPNAIAKLRRALGEANADLLLTQPRIGYRLDGTIERIAVGRTLSSKLELAPEQPVPGRPNFALVRQLAGSRGNEVWLAEHTKTRTLRVYKFCTDGERLRTLKREATLARVLQDGLEDRRHFVELIDWNFETPPFFLESEYGGESLLEWAKGRLAATPREERIDLFLQVAEAVAAAHSLGVLHKDLKPANVLIAPSTSSGQIRLTDFGSGRLLDPDRLEELGITGLGLTVTQSVAADSSSGTPLYLAPEVIAGHASTVQSDVYALGILLYQLLAGDLNKPMASGWESDIGDELLCEDIRQATHGNPEQRLAAAAELAGRLRNLDLRRQQVARMREAQTQARMAQEALARSMARRPYLTALVVVLMLGVIVSFGLYQAASRARDAAQLELERANAINRFLNDDLIGRSNPFVVSKGQNASIKDILLGARERIAARFAAEPMVEASIRTNVGRLFNTIELMPQAEEEYRRALTIYEREHAQDGHDALKTRAFLIACLTRLSKFDAAQDELNTLDRLAAKSNDAQTRYLLATAHGAYYFNHGDYDKAQPVYLDAIKLHDEVDADNISAGDSLRLDLIGLYTQNKHIDDAKREGRDLLAALESRSDRNELSIALAKHMLGRALTVDGDYGEAEAMLLDAQKTILRMMGKESTRNIMVLNDLFDVCTMRENWACALDYAQRGYESALSKFGENHFATSLLLANWGKMLYQNGDLDSAQDRLQVAYPKLEKILGMDNPQTLEAGIFLAAVRIDLGKTDAAVSVLTPIEEKLKTSAEADGAWKYQVQALRGMLLKRSGARADAVPVLRAAVEGMEKQSAGNIIYARAKKALAE